jgi:hypothetical protein
LKGRSLKNQAQCPDKARVLGNENVTNSEQQLNDHIEWRDNAAIHVNGRVSHDKKSVSRTGRPGSRG